ncbi:MAG TPA: hypothetical protein VK762_02200 [Polyangiaceae bacterium]|jgi:hypothetical protein|nr:hypothetical protein [Polyangiaceae bacterium]
MARPIDQRVWLLLLALAVAVTVACSSSSSTGGDGNDSGGPSTEPVSDAMTQG